MLPIILYLIENLIIINRILYCKLCYPLYFYLLEVIPKSFEFFLKLVQKVYIQYFIPIEQRSLHMIVKVMKTYWWSLPWLVLHQGIRERENTLFNNQPFYVIIVGFYTHLAQLILFCEVAHSFYYIYMLGLLLVH